MRLGDLDALKERFRKRIKWLEKDVHDQYSLGLFHGCEYDADLINEIPTIDAVPVVRCGECKHTREKTAYEAVYLKPECLICEHPEVSEDGWAVVYPEHFCSYGKRKEGEG